MIEGVVFKVEEPTTALLVMDPSNPVEVLDFRPGSQEHYTTSCASQVKFLLNTGRPPEVDSDCFDGGSLSVPLRPRMSGYRVQSGPIQTITFKAVASGGVGRRQ